jgi:hypothetical protein
MGSAAARKTYALAVAVCLWLMLPAGASAQGASGQPSVGVRAGVSGSPDQFYIGGHYDTGYLFNRLSFRPNVEVGFGDNQTVVALNVEFAYWLPLGSRNYSAYVGAGPALLVYRVDHPDGSSTDGKGGFNLLVGVAHRSGLFAELKAGLIDSPEVKFAVGYSWRW